VRTTFTFWLVVIVIVSIAVVIYAVHKVRRTAQERQQRSDERAAALLAALHKDAVPRSDARALDPTPSAAKAPQQAAIPPPARALERRPRFLTDTQKALFFLLREAMPDHLLMANVRVVDLLDAQITVAVLERESRLRELNRERLDFVVCSSDLVALAAIVVYEEGIERVPDETLKVTALRELGVRFVRFRAESLPRPAEVRSLILG
jgi:hypothetical protein